MVPLADMRRGTRDSMVAIVMVVIVMVVAPVWLAFLGVHSVFER